MHTRSNVKIPAGRQGWDLTGYSLPRGWVIRNEHGGVTLSLCPRPGGSEPLQGPGPGFAAPAGRIMLRRSDLRVGLEIQIGNVHRRDRQFTFGTFIEP